MAVGYHKLIGNMSSEEDILEMIQKRGMFGNEWLSSTLANYANRGCEERDSDYQD